MYAVSIALPTHLTIMNTIHALVNVPLQRPNIPMAIDFEMYINF